MKEVKPNYGPGVILPPSVEPSHVVKPQLERIFSTPVPLYDFCTVQLVITSDMRASEDARGITDDDDRGQAHTLGDGNSVVVIFQESPPLYHLAHEGIHVATHVLRAAGVKAGLKNDEPIAYLADWFVRWALSNIDSSITRTA